MVKELIFRLDSKSLLESHLDKLDEHIILEKYSLAGELGYTLKNEERTLELQVLPLYGGDNFELCIHTEVDSIEDLIKDIFGTPERELSKDASILDVAEFISNLKNNITHEDIDAQVIERFDLELSKYQYFKKMIIKQSEKDNAREEFISAAKKML